MPDVISVFEKVKQLFPAVDDAVMPFCESASAVIGAKLRSGADASDILLLTAAAAVAYCDYIAANSISDSDVSYFRAGDITVRKGTSGVLDSAISFRNAALANASALLADSDFDFRVV